jgi:hypothetical protein
MQTRGTFPALNGGSRNPIASQSSSAASVRGLVKGQTPTTVAPPKRRRQLTAQAPQVGNPFAQLHGLVGRALTTGPGF